MHDCTAGFKAIRAGALRAAGVREIGRQEGELRGKVVTIEALLGRDVPWATIEAATGIDHATFHRLKHEFADGTSLHPN